MSDDLTEQIIGAAIEVHRHLGPGLLESIYEEAMCVELGLRDISFARQIEVDVIYKEHIIKGQKLVIFWSRAKSCWNSRPPEKLPDVAIAQTLSYRKAAGLKRALLINFGEKRLIDGLKRLSL
ncbi:MAG: GxxExxY protein [Gemmataceae bacterium]